MKTALAVALAILSSMLNAYGAEQLCVNWEKKIEADMQMEESVFNDKNAAEVRKFLAKLDKNSDDVMVQFAVENFTRTITGYELRERALKTRSSEDVALFCEFYINEAYYHD